MRGVALAAVPEGVPFDAWIEAKGGNHSTSTKWVQELAIMPTTGVGSGDPRRHRFSVSFEEVQQLSAYAKQRKGQPLEEVIAASRHALPAVGWVPSAETADSADDDAPCEALELVALWLGACPCGARVTRAGIEARHGARGLWRHSKASEMQERW